MQSAEHTFATAVSRHRIGAHAEAATLYKKTLDENPDHTGALFNLASLSAGLGRYPEAATYYEKVLELKPDDVDALSNLGNLLQLAGQNDRALSLYLKALSVKPELVATRFNLANLYIAQARYDDAVRELQTAVAEDPNNTAGRNQLATLLIALERQDEAEHHIGVVLKHNPSHADARNGLGNIQETRGDLVAAAATFEKAADASPEWVIPRKNLARVLAALQRHEAAAAAYRCALEITPNDPEMLFGLAAVLIESRDFAATRNVLQTRSSVLPDDAQTEFLLGNLCRSEGDFETALEHLVRARDLMPQAPQAHTNLGVILQQLGRHSEAIRAHQRALEIDPAFEPAYTNLGRCFFDQDDPTNAIASFARAVDIEPESGLAAQNLGHAYRQTQHYDDAIRWFQTAIALDPNLVGAHNGLGNCYRETGDFDKARAAYDRAIELDRSNAEVLYNLAILHVDMRNFTDALAVAEDAQRRKPNASWAYLAKGKALVGMSNLEAARAAYLRATELDTNDVRALLLLAGTYGQLWQTDKAIESYNRILAIDPHHDQAFGLLVNEVLSLGDWEVHRAFADQLLDKIGAAEPDPQFDNVSIFNLQALPISYDLIARAARRRSTRLVESLASHRDTCAFKHDRPATGRPTVGFLLPYTHRHSLPDALKPVVEQFNRDRFTIVGFSCRADDGTEFSRDYRAAFDRFTDLSTGTWASIARRIYDEKIDILVDVSGHTPGNCLSAMALRPAPVQVHFLGYSITTGSDFVDYLIADRTYLTEECAAAGTESVVYLPDSFMITSTPALPDLALEREEFLLPRDGIVFSNFNHPCKFEPEIFAIWMRILDRVPDSVMWLGTWMPLTATNLRHEAEKAGIDPMRLVFGGIDSRERHLSRLRLADIALDTHHHGGGVTTIDALIAGVPVLSAVGKTPSSRMGATLLNAVGLAELVFDDLASYENRAVELANDREQLTALKRKLAASLESSPLFDVPRYTRHLERAFEAIWQRHCDGKRPADIDIPPI